MIVKLYLKILISSIFWYWDKKSKKDFKKQKERKAKKCQKTTSKKIVRRKKSFFLIWCAQYSSLLMLSLSVYKCEVLVLIVAPTVYPNLVLNYELRISKPSWEQSHGSSELSNQNLRQIGPGVPELWSDKQTDHNFMYII